MQIVSFCILPNCIPWKSVYQHGAHLESAWTSSFSGKLKSERQLGAALAAVRAGPTCSGRALARFASPRVPILLPPARGRTARCALRAPSFRPLAAKRAGFATRLSLRESRPRPPSRMPRQIRLTMQVTPLIPRRDR